MAKRPKHAIEPRAEKQARGAAVSCETQTIQYQFLRFDVTEWHDNAYQPTAFNEVAGHLRSFERMTWRQLRTQNPKHDHPVSVERLIPEARKRLQAMKLDDFEELWRLRFSGARRLWGVRIGRELHVLWWDPQHRLCPSELKHT